MSIKQVYLCDGFENASSNYNIPQQYIKEAMLCAAPDSSCFVTAYDKKLFFHGINYPYSKEFLFKEVEMPKQVASVFCFSLLRENLIAFGNIPSRENLLVAAVGTECGSVYFIQATGECLLILDVCPKPINSIFMASDTDNKAEKLIVLSEFFIMTFSMQDLQNIFIRSSTENSPSNSNLSIRTQKFVIPTPAPHYNASCSSSELPTLFDQLVQASVKMSNKSDASIPPISPAQSTYVVTSDQPFISFLSLESANYGSGLSSFASLLYVHAKKSIFSGRRWNNNVVVRFTDPDGVPATPRGACHQVSASSVASGSEELHLNKALADQHRKVLPAKMAVSSDRCWLAIPDGLGRVLLVDAVKQRVVRMWKGYRDAQVAFLDVPCRNTDGGQQPVASGLQVSYTRCLLIHAPRRRILEVWRLTHGPRLTAWDVEEPVRLIASQPQCAGSPTSPSQGFILDSRGVVYTIEVRRELCLVDSDAEAARGYEEYQVMQECYACLSRLNDQGPECVCSELIGLLSKFQTPSWFERSLLHVVHHLAQTPQALMDLLKDCLALLSSASAEDGLRKKWSTSKPSEVSRLAAVVQQLLALTEFHFTFDAVNTNCLQASVGNGSAHHISECDTSSKAAEAIADLLNWDLVDTEHCLQVYAFCVAIMPSTSHLPSPSPSLLNLSVFLDCFRVATVADWTPELDPSAADLGDSPTTIEVQLSSRSDELAGRLAKVGCLIFAPFLNGLQTFENLQEKLDHSVLPPDVLLYALTRFLTSYECFHIMVALIDRTHRVYALLLASFYRTLGARASSQGDGSGPSAEPAPTDRVSARTEYRRFRLVVDRLHDFCLQTSHLSSAYLVALVLRALLFTSWQAIEQGEPLSHALLVRCSRTSEAASSDSDLKAPIKSEGDSPASMMSSSLLHDTVTQWHDTCTRMDGLFRLGLLVQLPGFKPKSLPSVPQRHRHHRTSDSEDSDCDDCLLADVVDFPCGTGVKPNAATWNASPRGFPVSLGRVLYYGRSCITELFASWITDCRVEPEHVISLYQGICRAPDAPASSGTGVSLAVELALPDPLALCQPLFGMVYKRLPFTLELDTVLASVAWLYAQKWASLPEDITHLQTSVRFLESLSSAGAMIAQGLAKMIWFACLTPWISQLCRGCHEETSTTAATAMSGRMKSTSYPPQALQITIRMKDVSILLMDFFAIASSACKCAEVVPVFSVEREWSIPPASSLVDGSVDKASGQDDDLDVDLAPPSRHQTGEYPQRRGLQRKQPAPLANVPRQLISEMAVDERPVGQALIDFWEQVVIVAAAMVNFGPPGRPSQSRRSAGVGREQTDCYQLADFFSDNQSRAITRDPIDFNLMVDSEQTASAELQVRRRFFVSWLVERAVITCLAVLPPSHRHGVDGDALSRRGRNAGGLRRFCHVVGQSYSELELYRKFITGATVLARHWGFSKHMVLTHHIISLLETNLDDQAQLYLSQVQNATSLATQLMIVVGRRVAWQCFGQTNNTSSQLRWRACIPFHLEAWLRGLLPEPFEQHPPVIDTSRPGNIAIANLITLIDFVLDNLPDQASQLDVAESLRDAIYAARDETLE